MNEIAHRRNLTFDKPEGHEPLPQQLKLRQVSRKVRAQLWRLLHDSMCEQLRATTSRASGAASSSTGTSTSNSACPTSSMPSSGPRPCRKRMIRKGEYHKVFGFLVFVWASRCPIDWQDVQDILEECRAAYRVVDDGFTIMPIASPEDGKTIARAFADFLPPNTTARASTSGWRPNT